MTLSVVAAEEEGKEVPLKQIENSLETTYKDTYPGIHILIQWQHLYYVVVYYSPILLKH